MATFIQLPCGCRLTEGFVLGMCMLHVEQLQLKKAAERREKEDRDRAMLEDVERLMRASQRRGRDAKA